MEKLYMIDEPRLLDSLETWERHLEMVKRMPTDAMQRPLLIETARQTIEQIRKREAKALE